ncbi:hypothetical protein [Rhodococcus marinonascens]|uniref:hypothetical protein n=1 Tax=Rhodococcus marinonascens TaxID=38311 RepID=UPI0009328E27|nr:hypothetical protein [Rhodococcus marinonascens]
MDKELRLQAVLSEEQFYETRPYSETAFVEVQRLQLIIPAMPWPDVVDAAVSARDLLESVVVQSEDKEVDPRACDGEPARRHHHSQDDLKTRRTVGLV